MKLIRFTTADSPSACFGIVVRDQAVPFAVLQRKAAKSTPDLTDSEPCQISAIYEYQSPPYDMRPCSDHCAESKRSNFQPLNHPHRIQPFVGLEPAVVLHAALALWCVGYL
jgi:hypothetical protein